MCTEQDLKQIVSKLPNTRRVLAHIAIQNALQLYEFLINESTYTEQMTIQEFVVCIMDWEEDIVSSLPESNNMIQINLQTTIQNHYLDEFNNLNNQLPPKQIQTDLFN